MFSVKINKQGVQIKGTVINCPNNIFSWLKFKKKVYIDNKNYQKKEQNI